MSSQKQTAPPSEKPTPTDQKNHNKPNNQHRQKPTALPSSWKNVDVLGRPLFSWKGTTLNSESLSWELIKPYLAVKGQGCWSLIYRYLKSKCCCIIVDTRAQPILSLCQREIDEFCSVWVFMVVFFSFKREVARLGGSLQNEWKLPLLGDKRSMLKPRRFQRVQDGEGAKVKKLQSLGTCNSTEKLEIQEPWQEQETAS